MTQPAHSDRHRGTHGQPVHSITDADEARSAEQHSRIVKYTVSMSVRLACFIGAFFTSGPLQWVLLAGAVVLPYFAVIIANGGADRSKRVHSEALLDAAPRTALGSGTGGPAGAGGPAGSDAPTDGNGADGHGADGTAASVLLEGELVEGEPQDDNQAAPSAADPSATGPSTAGQGRP